ncbi:MULTISPECIES: zinc transporter ZntB [Psychrilyobacter]|uniref:Zinc transporter ZntB n=1 Tax=Psychrilyobacter piezotolerans TaxID=2293438 RepID=A0ABX9KJ72_9FUSO|nr:MULTISPECIES: zinc transporter ZntB [Psychrilyobacter]MCS5421902.1 zinc transporter ZntB [Psychrilyobacter sp. S5]NDI76944.1 zinc transporter ZntB [Psychrilyobacter piezotolerans]RDE64567.1 zinc transporter ZntB [Psychrilyobacter sp. S5]REI42379.1 zinc transporter ZntB [Psychrilyobacter piezotolerans]
MREDINQELIFSMLLDGKGGAVKYNWDDIDAWSPEKGILWMHLSLSEDAINNWINKRSGISKTLSEALLNRRNRPRILKEEDKLFLSLRAINFNPGADPDDMVFLHIYMEKNRIITIRHNKVLAVDNVASSLETGTGPKDSYEFLLEILSKISYRIGKSIQSIDDQIDEIEEAIVEKADLKLRPALSSLRRQAINIRRFLSPQREVLHYLDSLEMPWFKLKEIYKLKELTEKYIRYLEEIDSARDRAAITHEEINSIYSEQLNQTMYVLSIVATIFLPLGFLTGLLGINVGGIPGVENPMAFLIVCIVLIFVGIIELWIFKLKKWL